MACAPSALVRGKKAFFTYQYDAAEEEFTKLAAKQDKNIALYNLLVASTRIAKYNTPRGEKPLLYATDVMSSSGGDLRGKLSLISAESIKIFKGEPFEKAMAYFYLGCEYYDRGDFENARAAFRKALLMDKQSEEGFREDMRLAFFMLAKTFLKLGDQDNARLAMEKANGRTEKSPYPPNPYYDLTQVKDANLTVFVELGYAPRKVRYGPGASLDTFKPIHSPDQSVKIYIDGTFVGPAVLGLDFVHEADTRGSSGKDAVQATKGVARDAALVTAVASKNNAVKAGALLFGVLNQSQADIRQWDLLPGRVHVFSTTIPAGSKRIKLVFRDGEGHPLPSYQQEWYDVEVSDTEKILIFRSGPGKPSGLMPVYQESVEENVEKEN